MKTKIHLTLLATLLTTALVGCSNAPKVEDKPAETPTTPAVKPDPAQSKPTTTGDTNTRGLGTDGAASKEPAIKPLESIGAPDKRSVYFDYDKYDVRDEFKGMVADHAKFLVPRKDGKMLIQGNADERGSREYNLALGQRRADAVKKTLLLQGVKEEQVESVSLGEEKPKATGHDEAAWAENRRADVLYKGEY